MWVTLNRRAPAAVVVAPPLSAGIRIGTMAYRWEAASVRQ